MPDITITGAPDAGALQIADRLPLGRPGTTAAYSTSIAAILQAADSPYQGTWKPAANTPNISGGGTVDGQNYLAVTANPNVPETAPGGIPGIGGQTIHSGDRIIWSSSLAVWQIVPNSGLDMATADGRYVAIAGSTMTGTLITNANADVLSGRGVYATNTLYANSYNNWEWRFTVDGNGSKWETFRTGWSNTWNGLNGTRSWGAPSGVLMSLDGSGNLNVSATLIAGSVSANTVTTSSTIHTAGALVSDSGGSSVWDLSVAGTLSAPNSGAVHSVGGSLSVAGEVITGTATMQSGIFTFSPNYYWGLSAVDGTLYYVANGTPAVQIGIAGTFRIYNSAAYKPGGGSWVDPSDARIKEVTGDYARGLDDLLKLSPKRFRYLANNDMTKNATEREFVGFVAQEVEQAWPSMVEKGDGEVDGKKVSDLRFIDTNELTYATLNAIRELNERLARLETAMNA